MRKKLLSLLLAALMILGLLPAAALAAEGDTAPAAPAAEEEVIPAPVEELAAPTVTVGETVYTAVDTGLTMTDPATAKVYKVVVPNGTTEVALAWGSLDLTVGCPCGAIPNIAPSAFPLTGHNDANEETYAAMFYLTQEDFNKVKTAGQKIFFAILESGDNVAMVCIDIEGFTNTAPALASGVALYTVVAPDGETYTADVTKFFVDEDAGDTLTYYVSVNGGEFTKLEKPEAYTYTYGENFVNARLTFKANDGKADSLQNCTVILNNPEYPVVKGADSSTTNTETGKAVQLSIGTLIKHPQSIGLNYFVSIDGGEYKQVTLSSNKYTYAPTKAGTHTLLFKASTAKTLDEGKTSGVYTWTVTATGADIDNHAPVVKNPTEGPGQLGSGVNVTYWKPDLASIFSDPDGDTLTYSYSIDGDSCRQNQYPVGHYEILGYGVPSY